MLNIDMVHQLDNFSVKVNTYLIQQGAVRHYNISDNTKHKTVIASCQLGLC